MVACGLGMSLTACSVEFAGSQSDSTSGSKSGSKSGGSSGSAGGTAIRQDRVDWLKANVIPLTVAGLDGPGAEFDPIIAKLKDAKLVGLGEATHGTKEFDDLRFRMIRRMVETGKTRYILLEEEAGSASRLNRYLQGEGTLGKGVGSVLVYYMADPYLELYEWIRTWNREHPDDRVQLFGVDSQQGSSSIQALIEGYPALRTAAAPAAAALRAIDELQGRTFPATAQQSAKAAQAEFDKRGWDEKTIPKLEAERKATATTALNTLQAAARKTGQFEAVYLVAAAGRSVSGGKDDALTSYYVLTGQLAKFNALLAKAGGGIAARDLFLGENAATVVESYGERASGVYLAHNTHVTMGSSETGGGPASGGVLREKLGDGYRAVLTSFDEGSFAAGDLPAEGQQSKGYTDFTVKPLTRSTLSGKLAATGLPAAWLWVNDLSRDDPEHVWLFDPMVGYSMGGSFSEDETTARVLGDRTTTVFPSSADAVLFVRRTTGAPISPETFKAIRAAQGGPPAGGGGGG